MFVALKSASASHNAALSRSPPCLHTSPAAALDGLQLDPDESRALDYFLHRAAPCLAATQDGVFWTSLVPQLIRHDVATRSAVLAISCMFEHPPETSNMMGVTSSISRSQSQALKWQSKSIKGFHARLVRNGTRMHDKEHIELALLSCVLLTTIEFQQNNVHSALALLTRGYNMASSIPGELASNLSETIKGILVPILARQTVLMASFGRLPPKQWFERFQRIAPTSVSKIDSLTDARAGLYTCLFKGMEFIQVAHTAYMEDLPPDLSPGGPLGTQQAAVMKELTLWDKAFFEFSERRGGRFSEQERLAVTTMIMYYNVACIWNETELDATHMMQDKLMHRFQRVVDCAEALLDAAKDASQETPAPFSFEMGVIPPLFFTGLKCRHPLIRRKTVDLLRRAPRQEALFAAEMNARAIEKLIEVEEVEELAKAVAEGRWAGDLPGQEMRCDHAAIIYEQGDGKKVRPMLSYVRGYSRDGSGKPQMRRGAVPLY